MKSLFRRWLAPALLLAALPVAAGYAQAPLREPAAAPDSHDHAEIDPKLLIKAKDAHDLLQKRIPVLVDVRSRAEFNAEHIQGALSYPYQTVKMSAEYPFAKDSKLLLYCGCPHHLSGLSAEILKQKGYKDVHVIDEGYWGWKALGFPVMVNPNAPAQVSKSFSGQVVQGQRGVRFKDIFLLHPQTGQLEATRTDANGHFRMTLHFRGVATQDPLLFQMDDRTLQSTRLHELDETKPVTLELPEQVALRP